MKYSEFKKNVNTDVYNITENEFYIFVLDYRGMTLTTVSKRAAYVMSAHTIAFENIKADERLRLLDLVVALAITPLAEREEEKRYYLRKIPVPLLDKGTEKKWLWKYTGTKPFNIFGVDTTNIDRSTYQTIFTESEISQMDITGFEKIEVS